MGSQSVDLVYELQGELNWDKDFASSACKEYSRWLQLRVKTGDFQSCKLPPSRVVAMVWNLHRQWTMDYEKTCTSLGGFIHHYPPAMRMSFSREQGYAATLQTYKSHFKEEPPATYWEPPICPSRSNVAPPGILTHTTEKSKDAQALLTGSAPPPCKTEGDNDTAKKDATTSRGAGPKGGGFSRSRRRGANSSRENPRFLDRKAVDQAEEACGDMPSDRVVFGAVVEPLSLSQGAMISNDVNTTQRADKQRNDSSRDADTKDTREKESKKVKVSQRGGRKVQEGYVLRPLAPGEKRKRGRPSLSEYIPISEIADVQENGRETVLIADEKDDVGKFVEPSTPRSKRSPSTTSKGRKGGSLTLKARIIAPRVSQEANGSRPDSSQSLKPDAQFTDGTKATGLGGDSKNDENKNAGMTGKQQTVGSVRIGPDGKPIRRPRGRPRKDGSWPIPRAKRQQLAQPVSNPQTESVEPVASRPEGHPTGKQDGYLSTTLVPDTNIEHGDVPIPSLETDVGAQMLDTTEPVSNGAEVHGAVSERGQEAVL